MHDRIYDICLGCLSKDELIELLHRIADEIQSRMMQEEE